MRKTKYQIIIDEIRKKILSGDYSVGSMIPPESEIMAKFEVSRYTAREATNRLVNEGYLVKKKGAGTFVADTYLDKATPKGSKTIGVITTYVSNYIFPSILRGIESELSKKGYTLVFSSTNNDYEQEKDCLENMINSGVAGLIVEPTKSNQFDPNLPYYVNLREQGVPIVMINAAYEEINTPCIYVDDVKVGTLATETLIKNGHKNLLLVTKIDDLQGKYRTRGFIKACENHNIPISINRIVTYTTETEESIVSETLRRLKEDKKISAVFCYNDQIALSLYNALSIEGYKVPQDISIIGNDNSALSHIGGLSLTTLDHPKERMGIDAARWIIDSIENGQVGENILYEPILIERESIQKLS